MSYICRFSGYYGLCGEADLREWKLSKVDCLELNDGCMDGKASFWLTSFLFIIGSGVVIIMQYTKVPNLLFNYVVGVG